MSAAEHSLERHAPQQSRLWLWFVAMFLLQLAAWTAWFVIASKHKVAEVPLATSGVGFSPPAITSAKNERAEARPTAPAR